MDIKLNLPKQRILLMPASLWKRLVAFLIDLLIINFVILSPFDKLISRLIPKTDYASIMAFLASHSREYNILLVVSIFLGVMVVLYFTIFDYLFHQSPGQMLLKISIVAEDKKPKALGLWQCLLRNILFLPFFPFILLWFIEPIYLVFKHRRLLEVLSKTRTIEAYVV